MGKGTSYVDGGANEGAQPWGGKAQDTLDFYLSPSDALPTVTAISTSEGSNDDKAAAVGGYTHKVSSGQSIVYIKNIENINVQTWNDKNGDGQRHWDQDESKNEMTYRLNIPLVVNVGEIRLDPNAPTKTAWGTPLSEQHHFAWANGTTGNDVFTARTDVSADTLALMDEYDRGVWVDLGDGNNTAVGSAYGDGFTMGKGTSYVDGGANEGTQPWGGKAQDTLDIFLAPGAALPTIMAIGNSNIGDEDGSITTQNLQTPDEIAAEGGYTQKIINGDSIIYAKNIEALNVRTWVDKNGDGQRHWDQDESKNEVSYLSNIPLSMTINESGNRHHQVYVRGTAADEAFDASKDISIAAKSKMDQYKLGVSVELDKGNDRAIGSDYSDNFEMGPGLNYVDGGLDKGTASYGGRDVLLVFLKDKAHLSEVVVQSLNGAGNSTDNSAYNQGYTHKLVSGATFETTFFRNIEMVNIQYWDDKDDNEIKGWDTGEIISIKNFNLTAWYSENNQIDASIPFVLFGFGTAGNDILDVESFVAEEYPEDMPLDWSTLAEEDGVHGGLGAFVFGGTGFNQLFGTPRFDVLGVTQNGSNIIDGRGDDGYYSFASSTTGSMASDIYRMNEFRPAVSEDKKTLAAGGWTPGDFNIQNYRLVDLRNWTETLTSINANTTDLVNRMPIVSPQNLSGLELDAIGSAASDLKITETNVIANFDWAIVKRDSEGILGVDFLRDIETIEFTLWFDRDENNRPNGNERLNANSFRVKDDSYFLTSEHIEKKFLGTYTGLWEGSRFSDTVDFTANPIGSAGGLRLIDGGGNDQVKGTPFGDSFILSRGNDRLDGGDGIDFATAAWAQKADVELVKTSTSTVDGVTTIEVKEISSITPSLEKVLLTFTKQDTIQPQTWIVKPEASSTGIVYPINDLAGSIGTNTLINIEKFYLFPNGDPTKTPFEIDLVGVMIDVI
jgi:hypothetical protein